MVGINEGLKLAGLAALAVGALGMLARARRRRPNETLPAVAGVQLVTLRGVISGMEVAASSLVGDSTVECFGDYRRDPGLLVVEVQTDTEAGANRLIAEGDLSARLVQLLRDKGYPPAAIERVGLTIRSRERLAREAAALQEQEDIARWNGD